ncbi:MAG TPA: type II secretion system protein [Candidatus Acidoferrales bacterium]|nr:type II secretion system protein [Candidatus Acidoferrales bacterium]
MTTLEKTRREPKRRDGRTRGFTLLELMFVIVIIAILATISVGRYEQSVVRAHEAVLHGDLTVMRNAIQDYTLDKEAGPATLDDLHTAGYIGDVPIDPITRQKDWNTTQDCGGVLSPDQTFVGICDVHSSSDQISPFENKPYSEF